MPWQTAQYALKSAAPSTEEINRTVSGLAGLILSDLSCARPTLNNAQPAITLKDAIQIHRCDTPGMVQPGHPRELNGSK